MGVLGRAPRARDLSGCRRRGSAPRAALFARERDERLVLGKVLLHRSAARDPGLAFQLCAGRFIFRLRAAEDLEKPASPEEQTKAKPHGGIVSPLISPRS